MRNRWRMSGIVLILVLSVLSASTLALAGESDVPMFRGNAARTGEMPGPGPATANGISERWRNISGISRSSSPAVVDGVVYVGRSDGNLYAIGWQPVLSAGASPPAERQFLSRGNGRGCLCRE